MYAEISDIAVFPILKESWFLVVWNKVSLNHIAINLDHGVVAKYR